jgi:6-phosphogluconolactonase
MRTVSRRSFLCTASAVALAAAACPGFAAKHARSTPHVAPGAPKRKRVYVASLSENGLLAYHWDPIAAELISAGVAAKVPKVAWIAATASAEFLFTASELDNFQGKPTGEVASFRQLHGELTPVSAVNAAGIGTCHVGLDRTGRVLVAADYVGGSAASYRVKGGELSEIVWQEHYTEHGTNPRQASAHAHFVSFSPDNRYVYINDLGGDQIHIYKLNTATANLTAAGSYRAATGSGPRTLHFHTNNHTAYSVNEITSTVDVLDWSRADGSLTLLKRIELLPEGSNGPTRGCDTVITRDGKFVYFANRDNNFLYTFKADPHTGELTAVKRSNCGGKTPRHFTLDPTERWMLVANQDSNLISVFARNPETGELAEEPKNFAAQAPMRILFT